MFADVRAFRGNTADLVLRTYGAEYWVLRASPSIIGSSHSLKLRIYPEDLCSDDRWVASLICYNPPSDSIQQGRLWAHPEWISAITTPQIITPGLLSTFHDLSLLAFGTTHKAAVLVLTRASGKAASPPFVAGYPRFRLTAALDGRDYSPSTPGPLTETGLFEEWPAWSPACDELIYMRGDSLFRQSVSGGTPTPIAPSAHRLGPDWSPRGDWITFYQDQSFYNCDIFAYNLLTTETRALSDSVNDAGVS